MKPLARRATNMLHISNARRFGRVGARREKGYRWGR